MFIESIFWHFNIQNKSADNNRVTDNGEMSENYFSNWFILYEKGYKSVASDFRIILLC